MENIKITISCPNKVSREFILDKEIAEKFTGGEMLKIEVDHPLVSDRLYTWTIPKKVPFAHLMKDARKTVRMPFRKISENSGIAFQRVVDIENEAAIPNIEEKKKIQFQLGMATGVRHAVQCGRCKAIYDFGSGCPCKNRRVLIIY